MDEGVWIEVKKAREVCSLLGVNPDLLLNWFRFEEDAGKIRIHTVRAKVPIVEEFLEHFGRGIDLQELPEKENPKHVRLNWGFHHKMVCNVCNEKSDYTVGVATKGESTQICLSCISEMGIFYEMEKEKRDSRTSQIAAKGQKVTVNFNVFTNQGIVRDEGV